MKLKKIWKYFDSIMEYTIWYADTPDDEFKKVTGDMYEGIPEKLKDYKLIKEKYNEGSEAICPYDYKSEHDVLLTGMRFTVVKKQD